MRFSLRILLLALGLLITAATLPAWATPQIPDNLIYAGKQYRIISHPSPLESYFGPDHPRPKFQMNTTANRRGYVAYWEIAQGTLLLKHIRARVETGLVGLDYLFPGNKGRVAATWFTGEIRVTDEKLFRHAPQWLMIITLKGGKVTKTEVIDAKNTAGRGSVSGH